MQERQRIDLAFAETGKNCEIIDEIINDGEQVWQILVSEEIPFTVTLDAQQMLHFSADVAVPANTDLLAVYTALLQFNQLQTETGGVTMALDDIGTVEQHFRLPSSSAEPRVLQHVIENLSEKVLLWRTFLSEETTDANEATPNTFNTDMMV